MTSGTARLPLMPLASKLEASDQRWLEADPDPMPRSEPGALVRIESDFRRMHSGLAMRGHVLLYPRLADLVGIKPALMLGLSIGLSRAWLMREPQREGWFWMTASDWEDATSLSAREQETCRDALVERGFVLVRRRNNPTRTYYRVHIEEVVSSLAGRSSSDPPGEESLWNWDDRSAQGSLGAAVLFYRPLADLVGGAIPGVLLSQLIALQSLALKARDLRDDGTFVVNFTALGEDIRLSPKQVRSARQVICATGFVSESVQGSGTHARVHVALNVDAIAACVARKPATALGRRAEEAFRRRAPRTPGNQQFPAAPPDPQLPLLGRESVLDQALGHQSESATTQLHGAQNAPPVDKQGDQNAYAFSAGCPKRSRQGAQNADPYTYGISIDKPPPSPPSESVDSSEAERGWSVIDENPRAGEAATSAVALIVPTGVDSLQANRIVEQAPVDLRQTILDELAGHMASRRKTIDRPLDYLFTLTKRAAEGTFVPTAAGDVAARRAALVYHERRLANALATSEPQSTEDGPRAAPMTDEQQQRLAALRQKLVQHAFAAAPVVVDESRSAQGTQVNSLSSITAQSAPGHGDPLHFGPNDTNHD